MRIGELAAASGTTTKTLRFYEAAGLLQPPARTPSGYRDYDHSAVDRVDFVRRGRAAGLTLTQIREVLALRDSGAAPCHHVRSMLNAQLDALDARMVELRELRDTVARLSHEAEHPDPGSCNPARICRYL